MSTSVARLDRGETRPWCTFRLEGDLYGLDVLLIREVALVPSITPIPHAPAGVLGYVNLRGQVHLALDLRQILGRGRIPIGPGARLILFKSELGAPFGILVEQIADIVEVPADQMENRGPLEELKGDAQPSAIEESLVLGVARLREELLLLLDARRILSSLHRRPEDLEVGS